MPKKRNPTNSDMNPEREPPCCDPPEREPPCCDPPEREPPCCNPPEREQPCCDPPAVVLFTDGACSGNPGPGGWAFILRHPQSGKELVRNGGEADTTNNRMELMAVIVGLRALKRPTVVELVSDSTYVLQGLSTWMKGWKAKGWKRSEGGKLKEVKNVDLWQELDELVSRHEVHFTHVRGHSGHPENERCDQLAVEACQAVRR